jgi:uncharacterized membrane protein
MNNIDILDKITNIYTLRNKHHNIYTIVFLLVVIIIIVTYLHFMFQKIAKDNKYIMKQNDDIYSLILKKCIADNKYMSKPLLWT